MYWHIIFIISNIYVSIFSKQMIEYLPFFKHNG